MHNCRLNVVPTMVYRRLFYLLLPILLIVHGCDIFESDDIGVGSEIFVPMTDILDGAFAIEKNPHGIAPLSATLSFSTADPSLMELTVLGDTPVRVVHDDASQGYHLPVLGLYPDTTNNIQVRLTVPGEVYSIDTIQVTTGPLPDFFPDVTVTLADTLQMESGMNLSGFSVGNAGVYNTYPFMFDRDGNVRWYLNLASLGGLMGPIQRLNNGNLMFGRGHAILEYDMLGQEVNRWEIAEWQHHEVIEKPDGNLIIAVDVPGRGTVEDQIIEVDRQTGAVVKEWDMREILDVDRFDLINNEVDWFHMNAVWYDEVDDALIISGRNQGVVKVSMDNELMWILAPHRGWGKAGVDGDGHETSDFLLTAMNASGSAFAESVQLGNASASDFDWPWGQHAPMVLSNGNVFLFDNGTNRHFTGAELYSRGVEYKIDDTSLTVEEVWQYGKDRGADYFSLIISDVDVLEQTDNRLIMPGFITTPVRRAMVTEVTYPNKEVVFEASIDFKNMFGTGQGWGQSDIVYRSERMSLYP